MSTLAISIIAVQLIALIVVVKICINLKRAHTHTYLVLDAYRCHVSMLNAQYHSRAHVRLTQAGMLLFQMREMGDHDSFLRQYISAQLGNELLSEDEAKALYAKNFRCFVNELIELAVTDSHAFQTLYWIRSELLRPHINPPHPMFRFRPRAADGASWESVPGWRLLVRLHIRYPTEFDLVDPPESRPPSLSSLRVRLRNSFYIARILREFSNPDRPNRIPSPVGEEY